MIDHLPSWISILFAGTVILTIFFFYYLNGKSRHLTLLIVLWSILQSGLAYSGFYDNREAFPPRFGLVLIPIVILLFYSFLPKQRSSFTEIWDVGLSTVLHAVRVPVELVLMQLYVHGSIPKLMTFEGRNFDILMGLTAILLWIINRWVTLSKKLLLVWNVIGLIMVCFIFLNGILSAELPFQLFGFEQANVAILYFPFILLPATVVPIVIWTHVITILKLRKDLGVAD